MTRNAWGREGQEGAHPRGARSPSRWRWRRDPGGSGAAGCYTPHPHPGTPPALCPPLPPPTPNTPSAQIAPPPPHLAPRLPRTEKSHQQQILYSLLPADSVPVILSGCGPLGGVGGQSLGVGGHRAMGSPWGVVTTGPLKAWLHPGPECCRWHRALCRGAAAWHTPYHGEQCRKWESSFPVPKAPRRVGPRLTASRCCVLPAVQHGMGWGTKAHRGTWWHAKSYHGTLWHNMAHRGT